MEANELRIGNWILFGEIRTVVFGVGPENYIDADGGIYPLSNCSGIKINLPQKILV